MTHDLVNDRYLEWMYGIVCNDQYTNNLSYHKLFSALYDTEFYSIISKDDNRADDGIDLRYIFADDCLVDQRTIANEIDNRPCSVLEMMIALSLRIENDIMDNPDVGNRVGQWFWGMIVNLGLGGMNDKNFDIDLVDRIMNDFLNRNYHKDGRGGLFKTNNSSKDMRNIDIWYQMNLYLNELMED